MPVEFDEPVKVVENIQRPPGRSVVVRKPAFVCKTVWVNGVKVRRCN